MILHASFLCFGDGLFAIGFGARCMSQGNIELMPKKQVFDFQLAPRPEPQTS